jgi:hypothetical protein
MALGWWARKWGVERKMGRFEAVDRKMESGMGPIWRRKECEERLRL